MAAVTERTVAASGIDLHVAEAGPSSGPAVVLLHGFPDSWKLWRHQVDALAGAGMRVLAPDLRGLGETTRPAEVEAYRLRTLVADVTGLLDVLGVRRAAVVGHDWGAALAWRVAMFVPGRVERLVAISVGHPLAGVAAGLPQRRLSWYMLWFLFPGVAERILPAHDWAFFRRWAWDGAEPGQDPDLDRQVADLSRPGALEAGLNWYRANNDPAHFAATDPSRFDLPPVACPTMGVWSSLDFALTEAQMTLSERWVTGPGATNASTTSTTGSRSTPPTRSTGSWWSSWGSEELARPGLWTARRLGLARVLGCRHERSSRTARTLPSGFADRHAGRSALMGWGPAPRGRGRRYGYGRPGRRIRGYYRARPRARGPIPVNRGGCLLPMLLGLAGVAGLLSGPTRRGEGACQVPGTSSRGRWRPDRRG